MPARHHLNLTPHSFHIPTLRDFSMALMTFAFHALLATFPREKPKKASPKTLRSLKLTPLSSAAHHPFSHSPPRPFLTPSPARTNAQQTHIMLRRDPSHLAPLNLSSAHSTTYAPPLHPILLAPLTARASARSHPIKLRRNPFTLHPQPPTHLAPLAIFPSKTAFPAPYLDRHHLASLPARPNAIQLPNQPGRSPSFTPSNLLGHSAFVIHPFRPSNPITLSARHTIHSPKYLITLPFSPRNTSNSSKSNPITLSPPRAAYSPSQSDHLDPRLACAPVAQSPAQGYHSPNYQGDAYAHSVSLAARPPHLRRTLRSGAGGG
jgi:hypothetical protein